MYKGLHVCYRRRQVLRQAVEPTYQRTNISSASTAARTVFHRFPTISRMPNISESLVRHRKLGAQNYNAESLMRRNGTRC